MKRSSAFKKLLEPCKIGQLELRNRIVLSAMGLNYASNDGHVTARHKQFYEARAAGGVAAIVLGVGCVDLVGKMMTHQICIYDDRFVPGLEDLAKTVHQHGAKLLLQLQHGGRYSRRERNGGSQPVAPSPVLQAGVLPGRDQPRELSSAEISQLVERFAQGAERAKRAGLDGVEIHAGHGYLIAQFLSPRSNLRVDEYGGAVAGRARFLVEVIRAIRERVGPDYAVWCRIDGKEFGLDKGISVQDALSVAAMIEAAGVDVIDVSGYGGDTGVSFTEAPLCYSPGNLVSLAENVKEVVRIPVLTVGRISPALGEDVLRKRKADLIAMARSLIAEPQLPQKLSEGRLEDIRPCINCYTCIHQIFISQSMFCAVNAAAGREAEFSARPASHSKRVVIVGGGPAGLETASVAGSRGHRVRLYERSQRLGGSLFAASVINPENEKLLKYLVRRVRRPPIEIRLGEEVVPDLVACSPPDTTIVATGARLTVARFHGDDRQDVISGRDLRQMMAGQPFAARVSGIRRLALYLFGPAMRYLGPSTLRWLTRIWMPLGRRIAIIGGDFVACELADFLARRGRKVVVVALHQELAGQMAIPARWRLIESLACNGVTVATGARCEKICDKRITVVLQDGQKQTIQTDTVIVAGETEPDEGLAELMRGCGLESQPAGDCSAIGFLAGAIADGARLGVRL